MAVASALGLGGALALLLIVPAHGPGQSTGGVTESERAESLIAHQIEPSPSTFTLNALPTMARPLPTTTPAAYSAFPRTSTDNNSPTSFGPRSCPSREFAQPLQVRDNDAP